MVSTLVIAALFNPLHRRTQAFIDKRFYRNKYDTAKTPESFSARFRNEMNFDSLSAELITVVRKTMQPEVVSQAWDYFRNVQTKDVKYTPLIRPEDVPATWLNEETMAKYRAEMKKYYYDPTKYKTYLEQLGIKYPTVKK